MLSLQQQQNNNNNPMTMPMQQQQQENQYDHSSVNSQQGLADKIQAVRHLWESENQYRNSSQFAHQIPNYNQQQASPVIDPAMYNHMNTTFQQATQGFIQFQ